jgi:translation initiation factor IF-1
VSEFMGKVSKVNPDETIEVALYSGGYKTNERECKEEGFKYKVLRRGRDGRPMRRPSGLSLQFFWSDIKNGPVKVGDTVMVEMQPVSRPVRKI